MGDYKPRLSFEEWALRRQIPDMATLRDAVRQYYDCRDWYQKSRETIKSIFTTNNDYELFLKLICVTSQRTDIALNIEFAIKGFKACKRGDNSVYNLTFGEANPCIQRNIKRILSGYEPEGLKIKPFTKVMLGDDNQIAVDTHMSKLFLRHKQNSRPQKVDVYYISKIIRQLSEEFKLKPAQVQACLWCYAQEKISGNENYHGYYWYDGLLRLKLKEVI